MLSSDGLPSSHGLASSPWNTTFTPLHTGLCLIRIGSSLGHDIISFLDCNMDYEPTILPRYEILCLLVFYIDDSIFSHIFGLIWVIVHFDQWSDRQRGSTEKGALLAVNTTREQVSIEN